jgi:hypothetical protein
MTRSFETMVTTCKTMRRHNPEYHNRQITKIFRMNCETPTFQVLTAATIKMRAIWDIAPWSLVWVDRRFRGAYYFHHHLLINSSPWWWRQHVPLKLRSPPARLHSDISQKTLIFNSETNLTYYLSPASPFCQQSFVCDNRLNNVNVSGNKVGAAWYYESYPMYPATWALCNAEFVSQNVIINLYIFIGLL